MKRLDAAGSVVAGLADVAEERADQPAILDALGRRSLSFGELDRQSDLVAHHLIDLVGPGDHRVALALSSDIDFFVGAFGVLKASKTQVPLDLNNPPGRLEHIVDHSGASLIITDEASRSAVEVLTREGRDAVDLAELAAGGDSPPKLPVPTPSTLARIMYTSGSTGRPKGVVQTHEYVASKMAADIDFFRFGPLDRIGGLFPLTFAASTAFSYGALMAGATYYPYDLPGQGIHRLAGWIENSRITALSMVPTTFRRFVALSPVPSKFDSVRMLMMGAELVSSSDVGLFQQRFSPDSQLVHQFAATECGPIARFVIEGSDDFSETAVPAGFSVRNEIRILAEDGPAAPPGTVGEIVVVGESLTSGYWADPEQTEAAFGRDESGRRFYRTGDAGRLDERGLLHHLGRLDGRVKIRGNGVDLREVELALLGIDGVAEAVVSATDQEGETSLVAHITTSADVPVATIRRDLGDQVPSFMVPAHFVVLDEMPLTLRGKINRAALPPPEIGAAPEARGVPPRTPLERSLHDIWVQTLGIAGIGVTDDFFALGGSSVQAFEVFARIATELGKDLPPTTLLEHPTIRTLAVAVEEASDEDVAGFLVPIRRSGTKPPLFLVHGGGGVVLWAENIAKGVDPERPVIGIQPRPLDGRSPVLRTVEEMAAAYLDEVRTLQPEGPYFLGGYSFGGLVAYEMAQQLRRVGEEAALLALLDTVPRDTDAFRGPQNLAERAEHHRSRFRSGGITGRFAYVALLANRRRKRLLRRWHRWHGHRAIERGRSVPPKFRYHTIGGILGRAAQRYVRRPYDGPLTVFSTTGRTEDHERAWAEFARGGLEVIEVATEHKHLVKSEAHLVNEVLDAKLSEAEAATVRD